MRFPTLHGVGKICKNEALARQCYLVDHQAKLLNPFLIEGLDARDELIRERGTLAEHLVAIPLHDGNPQHIVQIGFKLNKAIKQ